MPLRYYILYCINETFVPYSVTFSFFITCILCNLSKSVMLVFFISFHLWKLHSTFYPALLFTFQQVLLVLQMLMRCLPGDGNLPPLSSHSSFLHQAFWSHCSVIWRHHLPAFLLERWWVVNVMQHMRRYQPQYEEQPVVKEFDKYVNSAHARWSMLMNKNTQIGFLVTFVVFFFLLCLYWIIQNISQIHLLKTLSSLHFFSLVLFFLSLSVGTCFSLLLFALGQSVFISVSLSFFISFFR